MESRCLYCYELLAPGDGDYHPKCSRKMFGSATPPQLPYNENQLDELALEVVRSHLTVTGVQPKLSLHVERGGRGSNSRFTVVGLCGEYILKPPSQRYRQLPEIEDLTMHMAEAVRIDTVPHCLMRMPSSNLAYLTRRVDRSKSGKLHMEDMCQITERLTENKYQGSYEQIAKAIRRYSVNPGLDVINFFEMVLFSFLTGNADMHLKNFSLLDVPGRGYSLAPAYDMLATALVNPADTEELALTLNGRKKKIRIKDFRTAFSTLAIDEIVQERMLTKFRSAIPAWEGLIDSSFLDREMQSAYRQLITDKSRQLDLLS
ncbi:MAG: HipA domain-containing protein [Chlorobiaceae bacterium]|nr:HipA domain-containing protein [Chlorobiaceae bacterium]